MKIECTDLSVTTNLKDCKPLSSQTAPNTRLLCVLYWDSVQFSFALSGEAIQDWSLNIQGENSVIKLTLLLSTKSQQ